MSKERLQFWKNNNRLFDTKHLIVAEDFLSKGIRDTDGFTNGDPQLQDISEVERREFDSQIERTQRLSTHVPRQSKTEGFRSTFFSRRGQSEESDRLANPEKTGKVVMKSGFFKGRSARRRSSTHMAFSGPSSVQFNENYDH